MNKQIEDIKEIRKMMEKSSKFTSINGLSLIIAGVFATIGGWYAKSLLNNQYESTDLILSLFITALVILVLAVGVISFFAWRKAKKNNQSLLNSVTRRAAYNLLVPLVVGGLFSLLLLLRGDMALVASSTLIFYGLSLVNASKYTFSDIHILGICEVIIGLLAAVFLYNGILFWILGFGVCHIVFGTIMYIKYDLKKK
ncbi:MAG: hypothetical protein LBI15_01950 [Dysgonamonadaceae bacterium]|nr:hypothetical protein [Dysgonamonadaceae bacterium]